MGLVRDSCAAPLCFNRTSQPMSSSTPFPILGWLRAVPLFLATSLAIFGASPADGIRKTFDLPADSAEKSIRRFSEQSGLEVFYPSSVTKGVRTQAVKGEMTAREALDAMVAGTGLIVVRDEKTGAFSVKRDSDPNVEGAASNTRDRPSVSPATSGPTRSALPPPAPAASGLATGEIVELSPFEVSATGDRGYYGANTMSGTRLNSRIEDLASSMTVVTKEQMADFAMLDINDIFNYEAGTEGTGTYTDLTFNNNGDPVDNTQLDPNNANRIRGLGSANISFGNFATSGRVPLDPINIDGVEISRGPNSNIFGLGNASGTVNSVPASANLTRDRSQVQFRADSYDGYRGSLDLNRVIKQGVLAVRGSAVQQHDGFVRKPSGLDTVRLNGMVKYQPFKATTITASYSIYRMSGKRPNTTPPRDAISFWRESGSPTWDPLTQTVFINGRASGVFPGGSTGITNPAYFTNALIINNGGGSSIINVNPDGSIALWTPVRATSTTSPLSQNQTQYRYVTTNPPNFRNTQPLFQTALSIRDKADYDWSSINLAAMNYQSESTKTANVQLEQVFYRSARQMFAGQAAWYQEKSDSLQRLTYATPSSTGTNSSRANSGYLFVDPNIRLLDGRPNPNFLQPNIGFSSPSARVSPLQNDTYRGQLAYQADFTRERNLVRWLGMHQMSGYTEYQQRITRRYGFRDAIMSDHAWLAPGVPRGNQSASTQDPWNRVSPTGTRVYYQYYVGDNVGQNVDYAPGQFRYGTYPYTWGNAATGQFVNEPALLGSSADIAGTGGSSNIWNILKTRGVVLQSHLVRDRVVTTFGLRTDKNFVKRGVAPSLLPDGKTHDYAWDRQWLDDWEARDGRTKTAGVVVKPLRWLSLHWNKSDAFKPVSPAQNLHLRPLPNPSGIGKDYGFALNLFDGKLGLRVNRYETKQINSRNGSSASFSVNIRRLDIYDFTESRPFGLNFRARNWIANSAARQGVTLTDAQLDERVAALMHFTVPQLKAFEELDAPISATDDVVSKGTEFELNLNPTAYWTLKFNATQQETITSAIAPDLVQWIAERLPIWQGIIDEDTGRPWFTSPYNAAGTSGTAEAYMRNNITSQLALQRQTEGKARPQIRKYRMNLSTNYRLAGITDHRILKRFNIGGGVRWEDKGAIGYYGLQSLPDIITDLDPNRPVWSKANFYFDAFVGYRTRMFRDKVATTVQLNARNLQEGGRLQPINAFPDGTPNAYRIVDPRQFILTVTFDL